MRIRCAPMTNIESVISRIRSFAAFKGWSKREYARNAKIQDTTLRDFDKPDWNPTRKTLRRMEKVIPPTFQGQPSSQAHQ